MNTLEEILKEANKYLRPLPEEADPTKMNEEDNIRSIEMRERLEPIERTEFEPIEPIERELKRAEDIRSIEKREFPDYLQPQVNEFEKMTPRMNLQPMRVPEEFEKLSPLGSGAIMRAQQFMVPEYDPEDQIMYDDIQREQLEYQRRLDYLQKLRERK